MENRTWNDYISDDQIHELTEIYKDYLYISRQHEQLLHCESTISLANKQIEHMNPGETALFPWKVDLLTPQDKEDFDDFITYDTYDHDNRAYIILHHIKPEENAGYSKIHAIPPYALSCIQMQLPSEIERCSVSYNTNGTLGDTEFFIDGRFKAIYIDEKNKDKKLCDFIRDADMLTEFYIMIHITEASRHNQDISYEQFEKLMSNIYATEKIRINEEVVLELLSSFAEKLWKICRNIYIPTDLTKKLSPEELLRDILTQAQDKGFIKSADKISEYINIRNFIRHQWDSLDNLGTFSPTESNENKYRRDEYVKSYLAICDNTMIQRAKLYIDALHQMQWVMQQIHPDWIIRDSLESNNKFFQRVKQNYTKKPEQKLNIEVNRPLIQNQSISIKRNLHKFMPQINILDDFPDEKFEENQAHIDEYITRSMFLQNFMNIECKIMQHCVIHGKNLKNGAAWKYAKKIGLISSAEYTKWRNYGQLRNSLSHGYFSPELRQKLRDLGDTYFNDFDALSKKLVDMGPDVIKLGPDVYKFVNYDGTVVQLDYKQHTVQTLPPIQQTILQQTLTHER